MRNYGFLTLAMIVTLALVSGCGGGGGKGSMMLKITDPADGATVSGNRTVTATMVNPAMVATVTFMVNGTDFETTTTPTITMSGRMDTLSLGLANGPATIVAQSTRNVYTDSKTVNINNPTSLYVQDISGNAGSTVTVHVKLNVFTGAAGYHIFLNYATSKLVLSAASVQKGSGVPVASVFTPNAGTAGVLEATVTGTTAFTSGDMLVANFQIKTPSAHGTTNDITVDVPATLTSTTGSPIVVAGVGGRITTN